MIIGNLSLKKIGDRLRKIFNKDIKKTDLVTLPDIKMGNFALECLQLSKTFYKNSQKNVKKPVTQTKVDKITK